MKHDDETDTVAVFARYRWFKLWLRLADAISERLNTPDGHVPCVSHPALFAGIRRRGNPNGHDQQKLHRALQAACRQCPVLAECRDYALSGDEISGFMAGMTRPERQHQVRAAASPGWSEAS